MPRSADSRQILQLLPPREHKRGRIQHGHKRPGIIRLDRSNARERDKRTHVIGTRQMRTVRARSRRIVQETRHQSHQDLLGGSRVAARRRLVRG